MCASPPWFRIWGVILSRQLGAGTGVAESGLGHRKWSLDLVAQCNSARWAVDSVTSLQTMCTLIEKTCSCDGLMQKSRFTDFFFKFLRIPWIFAVRVYTASRSTCPSYWGESYFSVVAQVRSLKGWDSDKWAQGHRPWVGAGRGQERRKPTPSVLFLGQKISHWAQAYQALATFQTLG